MKTNDKGVRKLLMRALAVLMAMALTLSMLPAAALAAPANSAAFTANTLPARMYVGLHYTARITVKNTGTSAWTAAAGYKLVCTSGAGTFANGASYALPSSVKPNGSVTFTVGMTAPMKAGSFASSWRMSKGGSPFGPTLSKRISVSTPANSGLCTAMSFPANAVTANAYTMSATFENLGAARWTSKAKYALLVKVTIDSPHIFAKPMTNSFTVPLTVGDSIGFKGTKRFTFQNYFVFEGTYTYTLQMTCNGSPFDSAASKTVKAVFSDSDLQGFTEMCVEDAEDAVDQASIDYAQYWVNRLPAGADKTALQARLDAVQQVVDVIAEIDALPAVGSLKLSDKAAVESARADYGALTPAQQALVSNDSKLTDAEDMIAALEELAADKEAALSVIEEIVGLPAVGSLTLSDKADVEQARADYEALTHAQQMLVVNYSTLTAAEARIAVLESGADGAAAQVVINEIAALPAVGSLTLSNEDAVAKARDDYRALTPAQQALVTNYADLQAAMDRIDDLLDVDDVISEIADLPDAGSLTLEDKPDVESARADYNALAPALHSLVTNYAKLTADEAKIAELEAAAALQAAKDSAHNDLDSAFGGYSSAVYAHDAWITLTDAYYDGGDAIDATGSTDAVSNALSGAIAAMAAVVTRANDLAGVKDDDQAALDNAYAAYDSGDYSTGKYSDLTTAYNAGVSAIDGASTVAEADQALNDAITAMSLVEKYAEELQDAKDNANMLLDAYVNNIDRNPYSATAWDAVQSQQALGHAVINTCGTIEEVTQALANAEAAIDAIDPAMGSEE